MKTSLLALGLMGCIGCGRVVAVEDGGDPAGSNAGDGAPGSASPPGSGTEGYCGVTTLASGLDSPTWIAANGDAAYVGTGFPQAEASGAVYRVPLDGSGAVQLASHEGELEGIAADDAHVYWLTSAGKVKSLPLAGGDPTVLADGPQAMGFALHDGRLFWGLEDGSIWSVTPGSAPAQFAAPSASLGFILHLEAAGSDLFAAAEPNVDSCVLARLPLDGSPPVLLTQPLDDVARFVVTPDRVVFSSIAVGSSIDQASVLSVPVGAVQQTPDVIAEHVMIPDGFAWFQGKVFWGGGSLSPDHELVYPSPIFGATSSGDSIETIGPSAVAFDMTTCGDGICWVDADHGTVMRYTGCSE